MSSFIPFGQVVIKGWQSFLLCGAQRQLQPDNQTFLPAWGCSYAVEHLPRIQQ